MNLGSTLRRVRRRWLSALVVVLVLFLGYLWAGYVLAPRLIRSEAMRWARARPALALTLGAIRVDPLHFTVTVHDLRLSAQGQPLASLQRLFVGLAPLSLLVGTVHLTALELDAPQLNLVIGPTGTLNLAALSAPAPAKPVNRKPAGAMPQIRIDDLRINQGQLGVTDLEHSPAARERLAPITLRLVNFRSWGRTGGRFALQAASGDGARLSWWGQLTMAPLASSGALSLAGVPVISLARFLPHLPVSARGGRLGLSAQYTLSTGAHGLDVGVAQLGITTTGLALEGGSLLHGLVRIEGISAAGGTVHLGKALHASLAKLTFTHLLLQGTASAHGQDLSLQRLSLAQCNFDPRAHRITIGTLAMRGLRLPVQRGPHGRLALLHLLPSATAAHRHSGAQPAAATARWHVQLGRLALRDALIAVQDRSVTPAAHFALRVYSFDARRLSNNLARPVPFTVHAGIAPRGYLVLSGRVTPARTSAALWVSISRLPLRPFVPYLPLARTAELHSGTFGTRGFAELERGQLRHLEGRADVRHLRLIERGTGIGLFGWRALSVRGIAYRPGHLVVSDAQLTAPEGQVIILPNRTLNLAALVPPRAPAGTARPVRRVHRPAGPALAALLERLDITDGSINFADESIEPHFHAPIDNLHGSITNLSTSRQAIAHIALGGQVIDQYSPVTVSGALNPYGLGRDTDIQAAFKNIQLPIFDPYSDRYAGYAIAKGILSARFRYRIDNRRLDADHRVEIDQLQWGGPSASKQSVGWPIRLATALLKDRNGVIRIHLPVTGSLSNPDFHIASIVWTMLVHLLEKAALAPFSLIGHLFAGAAQAQYIAFEPGSAALAHRAAASLAALAHALHERPALSLDIPAGPGGAADARALEDQHLDALALARVRGSAPGGFASLSAAKQLRALAALYRARLHKSPQYPPSLTAPTRKAATVSAAAAPAALASTLARERDEIGWLRAQLRPTVRPSLAVLVALGLARAQTVQTALLAHGGLSAKRVFITTKQSGQTWHGQVRLKLRLQ